MGSAEGSEIESDFAGVLWDERMENYGWHASWGLCQGLDQVSVTCLHTRAVGMRMVYYGL